jgi:hypothetical protein
VWTTLFHLKIRGLHWAENLDVGREIESNSLIQNRCVLQLDVVKVLMPMPIPMPYMNGMEGWYAFCVFCLLASRVRCEGEV